MLHYGPIPKDICVCHSCDNPGCVNPEHLFLGTKSENNRDRDMKGRVAKGSQSGRSKMTEEDVRNILRDKRQNVVIAKEFGVDPSQISRIRSGERWKHVTI